ncbi:VirB8/TrbF family protein [Bosea spartocytisi]|uniref:VirB8/TrbF family protein n=1 Tax=Bosea spartocytisi TaxID=2773451 RepID=UPI0021AACFBD|nr:VirB8/TrbF family protein [Bosea spartocytisi]MCT4475474.1 VirB8/TrbF family protein [Bosea spartocytisi]
MTDAAAPEPKRLDPRYYVDGASWEQDIARRNRNSRALAWIVATIMSVVAIVALGALALMVPLKTYEPYMVVVDKTTGFVEVKRPMAEGALTQDEAVTMFSVVRYIKARETYDPRALKDNFDLAQLLAAGARRATPDHPATAAAGATARRFPSG